MSKSDSTTRPTRPCPSQAAPMLLGFLLLAGCTTPPESPQLPRPVRVAQVGEAAVHTTAGFAGEVTARRETALAFRIAGKLEARLVEVGDRVRKGQAVARLDANDYRLATQNLKAQLAAAQAEAGFTRADLVRYRELLDQHIIAPPEFDRHQTADTAAKEKVAALEAQLAQTANQLRYSELVAERDGVIAGFSAEVGDVVAVGQPVALLAQLDEKEITLHVPEQRIAQVAPGQAVEITLWSQGERRLRGSIREVAPAADPATRTYRVKAVLLEGREQALLGMTATVWLAATAPAALAVPRSAVFTTHDDPQRPKVWLVEAGAVRSIPVTLGTPLDGERIVVEGVAPGQTVVRAGVQRLIEGQAVRVLASANDRSQP
ncbi:RND family efflux transporter, MFP subunit [Methylomagnum ishizawai]|uniref:RND family efflux transporter, MFP subunit n=1 Tax=Methylomagnum ishizawai TaxID=1760988 RepID=A0A1Y6CZP2_9GAMM|nr:efflux RND transporter periplasmic adaptor subunit [Methylomagnum ishizawai]SMF95670.1 RND family efflux transporter, MFP subunit [Methylomagnum ishizawai]